MTNDYLGTLKKYIEVLIKKFNTEKAINSIDYNTKTAITSDIESLVKQIHGQAKSYADGGKEYKELLIKKVIPFISRFISLDMNNVSKQEGLDILKNLYKYAGSMSLKHFIIYYEWDWEETSKFLEPRLDILSGYCHYLEELVINPNFLNIVAQLPAGYGKSRLLKYAEAWSYGIDNTGAILAICSNDFLIRSMSRSVIDIIQSKEYGEVFPHMDYLRNSKMFTKETDKEWRLATCSLVNSYMAVSRDSNAVGLRASKFISLDDMYTDFNEALDNDLNKRLWNKYITVYRERFVKGKPVKMAIVGTKWSAFDLISQIEDDLFKNKEFEEDKEYPYVMISTDKTSAMIKVPALDEEGKTTCPKLISTEELLEKKEKIPAYLWLCNYQQQSVPPEGLEFDYHHLNTYDSKLEPNNVCFASLDPARKGKNYVSMPIFTKDSEGKHYLIDALYQKKSMGELYDDIIMKIMKNRVIKLIVENNTDTSLPNILTEKLKEAGVNYCEVVSIYSYENKDVRIHQYRWVVKQNIVFPERGLYPIGTDLGRMMDEITSYSFDYPAKFDDGIDSVTLYAMYEIADVGKSTKAVAIDRKSLGL